MNKIVIIGGGAAGYFTAINAKESNPDLDITILEKGSKYKSGNHRLFPNSNRNFGNQSIDKSRCKFSKSKRQ